MDEPKITVVTAPPELLRAGERLMHSVAMRQHAARVVRKEASRTLGRGVKGIRHAIAKWARRLATDVADETD